MCQLDPAQLLHAEEINQVRRTNSPLDCVDVAPGKEKLMILYGLKNCDTCRKALKQLPEFRLVDVRAEGVPLEVLSAAQAQFGDKLVNTRSTTWRGLNEQERLRPAFELLQHHPALMKRPLIATDSGFYLGWDKATQEALGIA
jgi:arsenate reductase-like glutaredoxin family protein